MIGIRPSLLLSLSVAITLNTPAFANTDKAYHDLHEVPTGQPLLEGQQYHTRPEWESVKDDALGDAIKRGYSLFMNTQQMHSSGKVNNGMNCTNCHLSGGQVAGAAPMWAAYVAYPAYRSKNHRVNTYADRLQGCFLYSMNAKEGQPPATTSPEILDLTAYSYWLSTNVMVNASLPGRGFSKIDKPEKKADFQRGKNVYQQKCAICHGKDGQGQSVSQRYVFPPLWGKDSYNWGAGMHRVNTAAAFIQANMPLGQGQTLTNQQAWDVALFINSHERPQDPRYKDNLQQTAETFHKHQGQYGKPDPVDQHNLGSKAY